MSLSDSFFGQIRFSSRNTISKSGTLRRLPPVASIRRPGLPIPGIQPNAASTYLIVNSVVQEASPCNVGVQATSGDKLAMHRATN